MNTQLTGRLLGYTAIGSLVPVSAQAADLPPAPEPLPVSTTDWTGFYVGAGISLNGMDNNRIYARGADEYCDKGCSPSSLSDSTSGKDHGFGLVLEAGYDVQVGENFVVGIAGDVNIFFEELQLADSFSAKSGSYFPTLDYFGEIEGTASVVGRLGFTITPNTLLYGLGGATWFKYKVGGRFDGDGGPGGDFEAFSWKDDGYELTWTAGVGLETFMTEKITLKVEYRYTDMKSVSASYSSGAAHGMTVFSPADLHTLSGRIGFRY